MKIEFTIEEIRNYILKQDSLGDVAYNLSAENIIKANEPEIEKCENCDDEVIKGFCICCGEPGKSVNED